jgi:hypothetical protein
MSVRDGSEFRDPEAPLFSFRLRPKLDGGVSPAQVARADWRSEHLAFGCRIMQGATRLGIAVPFHQRAIAAVTTVREEGYSPHRAGTPAIGSLNTGSRAYWIVLRDMNEAN